jgi:hypothetical protein
MYVAVQHRIKDAQTALSRGQTLLQGEEAPPGVRVLEFYPSRDLSAATCLWEGDSVDAVRDYVDSTLGDAAEQSYFEVDSEQARGLPASATARA